MVSVGFSSSPSSRHNVNPPHSFAVQHWKDFPNLNPVHTAYDFDIHVDNGEKINWLYSAKQEKVYIKLNSTMNLTVSYVPNDGEPLHVRAMIVFSRREEMHMPVTRCPNHRKQDGGECRRAHGPNR